MMRLMQQFRSGGRGPEGFRWPNWEAPAGFDRRVAFFGYAFLLICSGCFTWLVSIAAPLLGSLAVEDGLLENLTAVFYLVAALLLLAAAAAERRWPLRCLYLLGAALCGFVAGEEIDWGQRLLEYATPGWFVEINHRDTTNFHNSEFSPVNRLVLDLPTALPFLGCLAACAARVCGKSKLLLVPLPTMPLVLGILLALSYWEPGSIARLDFALSHAWGLLFLIAVYALFARQPGLFLATAAIGLNAEAMGYSNLPSRINDGLVEEVYEYMLAAAVGCYALELLLLSRRREPSAPAGPPPPARPRPTRLRRPWLVFCALAIVSSLAFYPWEYFKTRAETAAAQEQWQLANSGAAGRPLDIENFDAAGAPTGFEVYAHAGRLVYTAQGPRLCRAGRAFFLHIFPANLGDLPIQRREYGYDNRDFFLGWRRQFLDGGRCVAVVPLPDYPIAEFRTGEYRTVNGRAYWQARQVVDSSGYQAAYAAAVTGRPVVRAAFDVYLSAESLTFIEEECTTADTAGMFIFHAFPVNPGDLPERRQGPGFDNLDFQFGRLGARFDGKCVAVVPLPDYPLDRIRVGQWLPQENRQLWGAEFPARR